MASGSYGGQMDLLGPNDDMSVIQRISEITGVKYSDEQLKILQHKGGMCILACAGSGKALKNGTGVLTTNGYVSIENLQVGDTCYGVEGKEQTVLGVFPQGQKEIYKVVFSDNTVIECCKDHLWTYQTYNMRRTTGKWKTDSLENILNNVPISIYPHTNKKGETQNRANIYIPMAKAVQFEKKELPISPYTMGALLGDGCLKSSAENCNYGFSNIDDDIVTRVNNELLEVGAYLKDKGDNANYIIVVGNGFGHRNSAGLLTDKLNELGIRGKGSHDKFIPDVYKYSSIQDRLELLQGLIDTDGYCNGTNYELCLASEQLIDDIKFIVETLGMTAVKTEKRASCVYLGNKKYTDAYRLYIKTSDSIPKIHWSERRESQWKTGQTSARRTIVDIKKTGEYADMTCIKVSSTSGLFLTENCVVTHNTTVLTHLLAKRIKTGEIRDTRKLLCTTYSKAGSMEMEERLEKLLKKLGINEKIQVKTLHASYLMVLKHFGLSAGLCSNSQRVAFITQACKEAGVTLSDEDLQLIDSLLSYQVNNLLSDEALVKSYVFTIENVRLEQYSAIRLGYNKRKEAAGVIDFDDMQLYMYMMLVRDKRQDVLAFCRNLWEDFFVDEFQDISKIQFAILRELVTGPDKIIVIGDDDQCIYQWRGADPNIILNICGYYDIQRFVLSTNYRCGGEIVEHAAVGIKNNEKRADKTMIPFNKGGKISICDTGNGNLEKMSEYAYTHIVGLLEKQGCSPSDIAILSRNNQHLSILNNMLFKRGIYCATSAEMRMTNMSMYRDLKNVMSLGENTYNHNLVSSTMWRICSYLGAKGAKMIADFMSNTGCSLKDALGYILTNVARRGSDIKWRGVVRAPSTVTDKLEYAYSAIRMDTETNLVAIYNILDYSDEVRRVDDLFELYILATEFMYKSQDKNRTLCGLVDYFKTLVKEKGIAEAKAFLRLTEQYESGNMEIPGSKITMSTMHGAKGREWPHVILFADDNITFPSFEGICKMLKDGIELQDISGGIDENRRLHYVAMTRAKHTLTIFTDKRNISVYTLEALGLLNKQNIAFNQHIIHMAEDGGLPVELINAARHQVFTEGSQYYYKIELGDTEDAKPEKKVKVPVSNDTFIEGDDFGEPDEWATPEDAY